MSDLRTRAAQAAEPGIEQRIAETEAQVAQIVAAQAAPAPQLDDTIEASDVLAKAHEAFSAVMGDVQYVAKSRATDERGRPVSGLNYAFRGIDALLNAVGPALRKHGAMFVPSKVLREHDQVPTGGGKMMQRARVTVTYAFVGPGGDVFPVPIESAGEAFDSGDKATPKAMSVALRTAYIQAFAIPVQQPEMDPENGPQYEVTTPPPPTVEEYVRMAIAEGVSVNRLRQMHAEVGKHGLGQTMVDDGVGGKVSLHQLIATRGAEVKAAQAEAI